MVIKYDGTFKYITPLGTYSYLRRFNFQDNTYQAEVRGPGLVLIGFTEWVLSRNLLIVAVHDMIEKWEMSNGLPEKI